jgi:hypothetical protein
MMKNKADEVEVKMHVWKRIMEDLKPEAEYLNTTVESLFEALILRGWFEWTQERLIFEDEIVVKEGGL